MMLKLDGLSFAYGDIQALDAVTIEVPAGSVGLVGANGAGKSTLLRLLLGILPLQHGSIDVLGHAVPEHALEVRSRVGYMPEGECLPPDQTAADFIGYAAELAGLPVRAARQRASDILSLVGLHEERFRYIGEFSTGMLQRAKLAQAIVHDPELVLLDEPTAGLDPEGRDEMLDLIERLESFGIRAVVSSHVLTDIERACDWIIMLDGGRVLRNGPLEQLSTTGQVEVEISERLDQVVRFLEDHGVDVSVEGSRIIASDRKGAPFDLVRDAVGSTGAVIRRLSARRTTLEDIFLGESPDG